jgi:DNA-binding transcriptional LysR family regulator
MNEPQDVFELKALLVLGREGSISGAAESLRMSQSDLKCILECFEKKSGKRLLVHHEPRVSLTPEGDEMVEQYLNHYLARLLDALRESRLKDGTKKCFN